MTRTRCSRATVSVPRTARTRDALCIGQRSVVLCHTVLSPQTLVTSSDVSSMTWKAPSEKLPVLLRKAWVFASRVTIRRSLRSVLQGKGGERGGGSNVLCEGGEKGGNSGVVCEGSAGGCMPAGMSADGDGAVDTGLAACAVGGVELDVEGGVAGGVEDGLKGNTGGGLEGGVEGGLEGSNKGGHNEGHSGKGGEDGRGESGGGERGEGELHGSGEGTCSGVADVGSDGGSGTGGV
mmetsp:Transcript_48626/g.80781  ORF Transcript_48626/g.80781 Transcript_48626/m.80781 type:complete len:236 (+) Transcript_48626:988-1695(+)